MSTLPEAAWGHTQQRKLFASAFRLTRNHADAEDLVQNTNIKALSHASKFRQGANLNAWLQSVLMNTFTDMYRKGVKSPKLSLDEQVEDSHLFKEASHSSTGLQSAEMVLLDPVLDGEILEALEALPEEFRPVVYLVDVKGMGQQEAAQELNIPFATVRTRLKRGRNLLRESLNSYATNTGFNRKATS